jgi:hypothetical protein
MSKRWTIDEDHYLAMYFDAVGAWNMEMDLGRTAKQCSARAKKLKNCGAWAHLRSLIENEHRFKTAYMVAIGTPPQEILDERLSAYGAGVDVNALDIKSYQLGRWIGEILGALKAGSRSMVGTWPKEALDEDREAVITYCKIMGLRASFADGSLSIEEPRPPELTVVK